MTEMIYTAAEVAARLQLPLEAVHSLARERKIRGMRLRGHWRFLASDVQRWEKSRQQLCNQVPGA